MSKYSSDSDSSRGAKRGRSTILKSKRSRSSSSSSSNSHSYQKKSYKHKHSRGRRSRSRSKSRYTKSKHQQHLHLGSGTRAHSTSSSKSQSRKARHKLGRSKSRDRVRSRSRERSSWKSRSSRSRSNSKLRSLSHSKDSSKHISRSSSPEKSRSQNSPNSRVESQLVKQEPSTEEQLRAKLQKAIKAAQSADDQLRQQGLLSSSNSTRKEELLKVPVTSESSVPEPLGSILDEINDSNFVPKHFSSSKSTSQILLDQTSTDSTTPSDTNIKLLSVLEEPACIFHSNLFLDPEQKLDKWIKKLFHLRQKAINGEPLTI